ncbi:MAG: divalent metal cation transporter [Planctomycetes bacterium]|nr:divalent metal cation transporter [Planctomycetota bacterium]
MAEAQAPKSSFLKALGPGLLFAGTSVGVSELVQCTQAGAHYSFALLIVVLGACVVKYPAFAFGPWYAQATGTSLLEGYRRQGKWALWLFLFVTLGTVFTVQAVVTAVAASILTSVLGLNWASPVEFLNLGPVVVVSALLLAACALLLRAGEYKWLDLVNKVLIFVLTVSTLVATVLALTRLDLSRATFVPPEAMFTSGAAILAVTSLVGWTPSAYDVSIWHSLWFLAHKRQTGESPTLKAARLDFNIGYWFSSFTSVCFLTLGACLMFQMNEKFPPDPVGFAGALINLYVKNFGEWCRPFLGLCAFSAMFSTVLNVTDGFPRVLSMLTSRFSEPERAELPAALNKRVYWIAMGLISLVAVLILALVPNVPKTPGGFSFGMLILVATTLSFLSAPFIGLLSHRAMFAPEIAPELRPGQYLRAFSLFSIVFNVGFGAYFVWLRFLS